MNYYGTDKYYEDMEEYEKRIFSKMVFDEAERVRELEDGYSVKYYYYADEENCLPGHAPLDGEICRLCKNEEVIFEWKNTDGRSRVAEIVHHSDGKDYFIFDEDLYGYSVLDLSDLSCMHYIPAESHGKYPDEFEETFLWCSCFYNRENNMLAVEGCYWACPYSVIVLDFSEPMKAVEMKDWHDLYSECSSHYPETDEIDFEKWDGSTLICKTDGKIVKFRFADKVEVEMGL